MSERSRITDVSSVPAESTFLFTVRELDSGDTREAILVELDEEGPQETDDAETDGGTTVVGWLNNCQHFTHIMLDKGSGAEMRGDEIICTNHGAMFDAGSGECTYGPCEGAFLDDIEVTVEDGTVYLTDPDFEFVRTGAESDDLDLTSKSNVEF